MKVLIIHAHPESQSFNGALTRHATSVLTELGHEVQVTDLYAMKWDPVSDRRNFLQEADSGYYKQQVEEMKATDVGGFAPEIQAELDNLFWADALIFQFPLWWFGLPAILKGYVDRVFAMGATYGGGRWYENGAFAGKRAMLSVTAGGPPAMYAPEGLNGYIDTILFPIQNGIFNFNGFKVVPPHVLFNTSRGGQEARAAHIEAYGDRLARLFTDEPLRLSALADYDPETFFKIPTAETE